MKLRSLVCWCLLMVTLASLSTGLGSGKTRADEGRQETARQKMKADLEVNLLPRDANGEVVLLQGQAFLVQVKDPRNMVRKAVASWNGQTIPCLSHHQRQGRMHGLGGVDRRQKPGDYTLKIRLVTRGGEVEELEEDFRVEKTRFSSGRLSVAGDKVDLSKEAIARIREERQAFRNAWDSSTYIRFWSGPFLRPTRSDRITSYFGERRIYNNGKLRNVHRGVDLAAGVGDPIKATAAGKVVLASFCYLEGGLIIMDHGGGLFTLYCHLSKLNVKAGDTVDKGHVIGLAGSTGRVTGPHLHWGCGVQGVRVDPMSLLELNKWLE